MAGGCLYPAVSVAGSAPTACQVPSKLSTALSSASHLLLLLLLLPGTRLQHSPSMGWHGDGGVPQPPQPQDKSGLLGPVKSSIPELHCIKAGKGQWW